MNGELLTPLQPLDLNKYRFSGRNTPLTPTDIEHDDQDVK